MLNVDLSVDLNLEEIAANRPRPFLSAGRATAIAQHGELFQGLAQDGGSKLCRCLVSLPCSSLTSAATFTPRTHGGLHVLPAHKHKALRALAIALGALGEPIASGLLTIQSDIPEGKGLGSSTADCVAAVRAALDALRMCLTPPQIARIVVQAETASGNVMFEDPVLFAQREGRALEVYRQAIPPMVVLGFDTDPDKTVETLQFAPPEYSRAEIDHFQALLKALRGAFRTQDVHLLGHIATVSGRINQRYLPKPCFEEVSQTAVAIHALGVAVAHTGTVMGILLDSADLRSEAKIEALRRRLESLGIERVIQYEI